MKWVFHPDSHGAFPRTVFQFQTIDKAFLLTRSSEFDSKVVFSDKVKPSVGTEREAANLLIVMV
jgi:hypothetical protein